LSVFIYFWRCIYISKQELPINEEIEEQELRVIDNEGNQLGIMKTSAALKIAQEKDLDLVIIAPNASPVVCKIMDYGKYRFEQAKKEKDQRKNQKTIELKEIRLSYNIDVHDFETKLNQAKKFISSGNKVKVSIRFRGREMAHKDLGNELLNKVLALLTDDAIVEGKPQWNGRNLSVGIRKK